ncbi:HlyD family secretion protein [Bacteroides sp. OF04-15BH]|uniref:HlyD family secretion protein n=1 Tax=Bacteroides sp. OF04-15BH TaxID=2292281 RepID=UPI000E469177|nr:HlyD family secretion protein [Bacteroides sp. OF04-15BH]RHP65957.1 HlyD family secretion protein [Bacteroides sp. OF04-15BH]
MEKNLDRQDKDMRQEKVQKLKKMRRWQIVASVLGVAVLGVGIWQTVSLFLDYKHTEVSNDAQVEQYISPINMRASGYIKKICFTEHQEVHKGDTLLILDDREYKIRVMEAEAALKDAQAGATVIDASLETTENNASVFEASLAEVEVRLAKLEKDRQRYQNLVARNAATPIQLEQIETEYAATLKKKEAIQRQQCAARSGVKEVSRRRMNTEAAIQRAEAALEMARLNLSYTVVVAPCDGKLGRRAIEEGQMVNAGQTITNIIPDTQKWIIANYKEKQIENLHVGQEVEITVDALKDKTFKGRITAISGATGSKYSLVPTDNSAGNFVKIQQRIPVRIDFEGLAAEDHERLAAGMMVVVKAKL